MTNTFRVFVKDQADPIRVQAGGFLINPSFPPITFTTDQERRHPIDINTISGHEKFTKDNLLAVSIEQNDPSMKKLTITLSNEVSFNVQADTFTLIPPPDISQAHGNPTTIAGMMAMGYQQGSISFSTTQTPITTWVAPDALAEVIDPTLVPATVPNPIKVFVKNLPDPILVQAGGFSIQVTDQFAISFTKDEEGRHPIDINTIPSHHHFKKDNLLAVVIDRNVPSMKKFTITLTNDVSFVVQGDNLDINQFFDFSIGTISVTPLTPHNHQTVWVAPGALKHPPHAFVGHTQPREQESLDKQQYGKCD